MLLSKNWIFFSYHQNIIRFLLFSLSLLELVNFPWFNRARFLIGQDFCHCYYRTIHAAHHTKVDCHKILYVGAAYFEVVGLVWCGRYRFNLYSIVTYGVAIFAMQWEPRNEIMRSIHDCVANWLSVWACIFCKTICIMERTHLGRMGRFPNVYWVKHSPDPFRKPPLSF